MEETNLAFSSTCSGVSGASSSSSDNLAFLACLLAAAAAAAASASALFLFSDGRPTGRLKKKAFNLVWSLEVSQVRQERK